MAPIPDGNQDGPNGNENDVRDMEMPQFNVDIDSDSSSNEEMDDGPAGMGYELLPQEPDTIDVDDHPTEQEGIATSHDSSEPEDSSLDNTVKATLDSQLQYATTKTQQMPTVLNAQAAERREVWETSQNASSTPMNTADVQTIKAVMANIKLPTPDWAKEVTEDQWKRQLLTRLKSPHSPTATTTTICSTSHSTSNICNQSQSTCIESKAEHKQSSTDEATDEHNKTTPHHCGKKDTDTT